MADLLEKARITFTGKMASMSRCEAWRVVREHGGEPAAHVSHRTTMLVVGVEGWHLLPDGEISFKLRRAEELRVAGCPIRIVPELEFLALIGRALPDAAQCRVFPAGEVCRILRIERGTLRCWEQSGLIQSRDGFYDFQDLVSIRAIHDLVHNGVHPEKIARSLHTLAAVLPGLERPLAQLRVIATNPDVLLIDQNGVRFSTSGQLLFDFEDEGRIPGVVLPLSSPACDPADLFERGVSCEEEGMYAEAADAFQAFLQREPHSSQAYFHLGNVMHEMGILWAAEECYITATSIEPRMLVAWSCLAGVQEEQGKTGDAITSYQAALAVCPDYADGHFNLAMCYEKMGLKRDACRHWFAYLKLDPGSASACVARRQLSVQPELH